MKRDSIIDKVFVLKCEVLKEIRELLPKGRIHTYREPFFIHYVEGEVATTELCTAIENEAGMIKIHYKWAEGYGKYNVAVTEGEGVLCYTIESLADMLHNLKSDFRGVKLSKIREIVANAGGKMEFDGSFTFTGYDDTCLYECNGTKLIGLLIDNAGNLKIEDVWENDNYTNDEKFLPYEELDRIILYLESQVKRKYSIKVIESNVYEVEATSYEEAVEIVKKRIEVEPLKRQIFRV